MEHEGLKRLDREARREFCSELVARLSDLVEGEAPEELCQRVQELLGDCQAFQVYKATLADTIDLARECGGPAPVESVIDREAFASCVEKVRSRLTEAAEEE